MDESRKAFEQWAESNGHDTYRSIAGGGYYFQSTQWSWDIWQASRAAIEINLPDIELVTDTLTAPGDGWEVYDAQKVDKILRAAGIKVKE